MDPRMVRLEVARKQTGMSRPTFWRFRKRHKIPTLTGRKVHLDDVDRGFREERGLTLPAAP